MKPKSNDTHKQWTDFWRKNGGLRRKSNTHVLVEPRQGNRPIIYKRQPEHNQIIYKTRLEVLVLDLQLLDFLIETTIDCMPASASTLHQEHYHISDDAGS